MLDKVILMLVIATALAYIATVINWIWQSIRRLLGKKGGVDE